MKTKLFIFSILFLSLGWTKELPNKIYLQYQLKYEDQNLGLIQANYQSKNKTYELNAVSDFQGAMKLLGNYEIKSYGQLNGNHLQPKKIERINLKKNKQVTTEIDYLNKKIVIDKKNKKKIYELQENTQDIMTYFFEINAYKKLPEKFMFNILDSDNYNQYEYQFIKNEEVKILDEIINTKVYVGSINQAEEKHYLWISDSNYRIPVKIITQTPIGILVDQVLIDTSLQL
ncbi:MAG: DUF3108 domain-containing protein [Nitrosomonadales bacterium]